MTQAKAKSNSVVTSEWSGTILSITVLGAGERASNGVDWLDETIMFDQERASAANREHAERAGWLQRIVDTAAISRVDKDGTIRSPRVMALLKSQAIRNVVAHYENGAAAAWRMKGGSTASEGTLLFRALRRIRPNKSAEQVREFLGKQTPDQMRAIRARRDVVEAMNQLRLEDIGDQGTGDALAGL